MALVNTSKPTPGAITNTARATSAELWSTITTTWAAETRTWADCASLIDNISKPTTGAFTNVSKP